MVMRSSVFKMFPPFVQKLNPKPKSQVAVVMGSPSDKEHCEKIKKACEKLGVPCELRVASAHKNTDQSLDLIAEYEGTPEGVLWSRILRLHPRTHFIESKARVGLAGTQSPGNL